MIYQVTTYFSVTSQEAEVCVCTTPQGDKYTTYTVFRLRKPIQMFLNAAIPIY